MHVQPSGHSNTTGESKSGNSKYPHWLRNDALRNVIMNAGPLLRGHSGDPRWNAHAIRIAVVGNAIKVESKRRLQTRGTVPVQLLQRGGFMKA